MTDLISREAALEILEDAHHGCTVSKFLASDDCIRTRGILLKCIRDIEDAPAVDAEPVRHGRWIEREDKTICSSCDTPLPTVEFTDAEFGRVCVEIIKTTYCPNCGAHMMDEEVDG